MQIFRKIPHATKSPIALAIGNFDGVHLGHQEMLKRLGQAAFDQGIESCVITFEPHPREFFAPDHAPARLTSLREKLELFASYGVQRTHIFRFDFEFAKVSAENFIQRILVAGLDARWLIAGNNFRFGARRAGDTAMLQREGKEGGIDVVCLGDVSIDGARVSSTAVREALATADLALAKKLLGRHYSISGRIVKGDQIGRKLGFHTANVQMRHNMPPLSGVFAVEVHAIGTRPLQGVANLGKRPTVNQKNKWTLEVHLFNFNRDIYGEHMRVDFVHYIRGEQKFQNLDGLKQQIAADAEAAKNYFLT